MSISRFEFVMFYFFVFFCLSPGFVSPLPLLGACIPPFLPPSVFFCTFFFCYSLHVFISCRFRLFAEQLLVAVTLTSVIFFFYSTRIVDVMSPPCFRIRSCIPFYFTHRSMPIVLYGGTSVSVPNGNGMYIYHNGE